MSERYIKIVGIGLIGDGKQKGSFRQIVFQDTETGRSAEFLIYKKERPSIWADIKKLEQGKNIPPYRGYITRYNAMELVVFDQETLEDAFKNQKWKLNIESSMHYANAEKMRQETKGYITNLTTEGAMEISWRSIDQKASLVKFRLYEGTGIFAWTKWIKIS